MDDHIFISFISARRHLDFLEEERRRADDLYQCLVSCLREERENPAGRPELILQELRRVGELLERIGIRRSIVQELIDECSRSAYEIDEVLDAAVRSLRRAE